MYRKGRQPRQVGVPGTQGAGAAGTGMHFIGWAYKNNAQQRDTTLYKTEAGLL